MNFKVLIMLLCSVLIAACSDSSEQLNEDYGDEKVRERQLPVEDPLATEYRDQIKPLLEKRCVVCHGCYDAPCQLKLSSPEGIDRGASKHAVYDGSRILGADLSRLFIDAQTTEEWRQKEFTSVLNERDQTLLANLEGSVMYQLLLQKERFPQPQGVLPEEFNYTLSRQDQCPDINELSDYKEEFPLAGMPYGLPNLSRDEFKALEMWIGRGAPMSEPVALSDQHLKLIEKWEKKINGDSLKEQLIARYLYEHLFLGHVYFDDVPISTEQPPRFFHLVRSTTPPGKPVEIIATRRPYDDPKVKRVYYRLVLDRATTLAKTNLPYVLNKQREEQWDHLFYNTNFTVNTLPDYEEFNPFLVFKDIPAVSRYQFLLQEAYFTISGFIKGPVCRGQVAVNVINDKFWVFFVPPDMKKISPLDQFIYEQAENLRLPAESSSDTLSVAEWLSYSKGHGRYIKARSDFIDQYMDHDKGLTLGNIWSGNENAALTVFRHVDSATVVKGALGEQPKTAWVIDYPILERIHYLLVAGFDVYGNVGHQLTTRLYMDFLRIESEANFVSFLPNEDRQPTLSSWYLGATKELTEYLNDKNLMHSRPSGMVFTTQFTKEELLTRFKQHTYSSSMLQKKNAEYRVPEQDLPLKRLGDLDNQVVLALPPVSFIIIEDEVAGDRVYSLLRHNAHKNVASLLNEKANRLPLQDSAEVFKGFLGTYPGLIFKVAERDKRDFVNLFVQANDAQKFQELITRYGVRRSNPNFWSVSDQLHKLYLQQDPIEYGLFDYNRLINR
ncbi:9-hexadecenoic acid cis-trans isomerase [Psychromonas sp. RZ22]|uniref:fatty acid cis/trans isomerase n=1 Tax=Psychromonas algarum TaxID=2555643 RepID=UPI001067D286|nr:fatty acid cis/trans isomerase [Psychromonas sp. RZ22]TEW53977.1 9-hexadecenoic acid cis-trans isomerase [Psychromonas sp. RZ22]